MPPVSTWRLKVTDTETTGSVPLCRNCAKARQQRTGARYVVVPSMIGKQCEDCHRRDSATHIINVWRRSHDEDDDSIPDAASDAWSVKARMCEECASRESEKFPDRAYLSGGRVVSNRGYHDQWVQCGVCRRFTSSERPIYEWTIQPIGQTVEGPAPATMPESLSEPVEPRQPRWMSRHYTVSSDPQTVKAVIKAMTNTMADLGAMVARVACPDGLFELGCTHDSCERYRNERMSIFNALDDVLTPYDEDERFTVTVWPTTK